MSLRKVVIALGVLFYLLIGNGLGRMSWDIYYGNENNFGGVNINAMRPILFPSCALIVPDNACYRSGEMRSFAPLIKSMPRPVYLFLMTFFWLLKIIFNAVGLAGAHLLVYLTVLINSLVSMFAYIYHAFLW